MAAARARPADEGRRPPDVWGRSSSSIKSCVAGGVAAGRLARKGFQLRLTPHAYAASAAADAPADEPLPELRADGLGLGLGGGLQLQVRVRGCLGA